MKKGDKVYYARILPPVGIYEVCDLTINTVAEDYFTGVEKHTKRTYIFSYAYIDNLIFYERSKALEKVLKEEENKVTISSEKYYEEY